MDRHAEGAGASRDAAADPAHAENAEILAEQLDTDKLGRIPPGPMAAADEVDALGRAPCRAEHQKQADLGDRVGQDAGRVEHGQAAGLSRRDIDMLVADRVGSHALSERGRAPIASWRSSLPNDSTSTSRPPSAAFGPSGGMASMNVDVERVAEIGLNLVGKTADREQRPAQRICVGQLPRYISQLAISASAVTPITNVAIQPTAFSTGGRVKRPMTLGSRSSASSLSSAAPRRCR